MEPALRPRVVLLALLCGLPITFIAAYGLPWMALTSLAMLISTPSRNAAYGVFFTFASVLALATYWRIAFATASGKRFQMGPIFWAAVVCAAFTSYEFNKWFGGPEALLALIAPMVLSACYFIYQQRATDNIDVNEA